MHLLQDVYENVTPVLGRSPETALRICGKGK